jgi:hypothetical protein
MGWDGWKRVLGVEWTVFLLEGYFWWGGDGRMGEWEGWGCTIVFMTLDYSRLLSINS